MNKPIMNPSEPEQYKKGWVEFYKLKFKVNANVLIPRPETELLVDIVLNHLNPPPTISQLPATILDVGTGAGNIAISIIKNLQPSLDVRIVATDVSDKALRVAKQNAKFHGVSDKITFIQSDLLLNPQLLTTSIYPPAGQQAGLPIIVTNLPYIPSSRIPYLDSSVKDFEPHVALDGGEDGFELYRKLFQQIKQKNLQFSLLVGEIDYTHGELAMYEANLYFPSYNSDVKLDLTHKQRILIIKHP